MEFKQSEARDMKMSDYHEGRSKHHSLSKAGTMPKAV